MCDHGIREHVGTQRGGSGDDDAGGDGDPSEATVRVGAVKRGERVLQGGGVGCHLFGGYRRYEHADGDRSEPDISGDVEELLPS